MKKYIAELIGTFFFALTIFMAIYSKVSADLQPLAMGATFIAMIYAMGHVTGAHFNPAVSLAMFIRNKISWQDMSFYIIAQILGGILAAYITLFLISGKPLVAPIASPPQFFAISQAILAELLGTFALVWVILTMASAKALEGNYFYGFAIGLTVIGMGYALGSVSSGIFNPAIAIGARFAQLGAWSNLWIYLVACPTGGALAAFAYKYLSGED
jgi:aquaporin Z